MTRALLLGAALVACSAGDYPENRGEPDHVVNTGGESSADQEPPSPSTGGSGNDGSLPETGGTANATGGTHSGGVATGGFTGGTDGSGGEPGVDPEVRAYRSGARLKRRNLVGSDGTVSFVSWYDSSIGEACSFLSATDATTRCLPGTFGTITYHSDGSCTLPVVSLSACAPPAYFYSLAQVAACTGNAFEVRQRGAAFTGSTVYFKSGENCVGTSNTQAACEGLCFYHVGAVVPPSSFVAADYEIED